MTSHRFRTQLVPGRKRPYDSWTFVVIPPNVASGWGPGQKAVRGSIAGHAFQGTASRGEGVMRVPIPSEFRGRSGLRCGDTIEVVLELDPTPRTPQLPDELRAVLEANPEVAAQYEKLAPSMRRAWATHVAEARRPETRLRRARQAVYGIRNRVFP